MAAGGAGPHRLVMAEDDDRSSGRSDAIAANGDAYDVEIIDYH
jgi:hypothetical protein